MRSIPAFVRDVLLLESADETRRSLDEERRREIANAVERAEALDRSAEALFAEGLYNEAMERAEGALEGLRAAAGIDTGKKEEWPADIARAFADLRAEAAALHRRLAPLALDDESFRRTRIQHAVSAIAFSILGVVLAGWALHTPRTLKATASASWGISYEAPRAVDGDIRTEWLLPDHQPGTIELEVIPPRAVREVRLLNARNVPYDDRGTGKFRVTAFFRGNVVATADDAFTSFSEQPTWRVVPIRAAKVDRVRVDVETWLLSGGGFGEIVVE